MKKINIKKIAERNRQRLANNPTQAEVKFRMILIQLKIPYTFQQIIYTKTSFFIADFVAVNKIGKKYVMEIDGFKYHGTYSAKKKDSNRSSKIRIKAKYGVLRFKNEDVLNNPNKVLRKLKRYKFV